MHNINITNGRASIALATQSAWHRLGQILPDAFDSATAIREAGLCTGPIIVTLDKSVPPEHVDGEDEGEIRQKPLGILMPCRVN